jgi:superfamily II DNA or RNA helicase
MDIVISDKLHLVGFSPERLKTIKEGCQLNNQMFWKMKKMGRPFVHLSPFIKYFEEDKVNGSLKIGRGCLPRLLKYCESNRLAPRIHDLTVSPSVALPPLTISLRPYQLGKPEEIIKSEHGLCRFSTGYGKTILALKVVELLQTRTLIIVPLLSGYEQFKTDIKKGFDLEAGSLDSTEPIVVATIQALQRRLEAIKGDALAAAALANSFGLVIIDECHRTVPEKSRDVVEFFKAKYRYGFTATPRRTDGQGDALAFIFGPIISEGDIERASPTVRILEYHDQIPVDEYHEIINAQIEDQARNTLICEAARQAANDSRRVLILTKRVEHYERLAEELADLEPLAIKSTGKAKDRALLLADLRSGSKEFKCLLGTFSLLSTGVDIPSLDTLIIAGDLKSDVLAEQSAGRILRLFEGKADPIIIDINDVNNPILRYQGRERRKFYKEQGWQITAYKN